MIVANYKGSGLSTTENEHVALERISATLLRKEPQLATSAWFDYRLMHPTQRTYLFAHYYEKAFQHMIRLHVDYKQVEGPSPRTFLPKDDPLDKPKSVRDKERRTGKNTAFRTTTTVWKARQKADELGIPYDVYTMSGMKAAIGQIWQRIPTPAQLYSQRIVDDVIDRWATLASEQIYAAKDPFYLLEHWQNHPSQIEHAHWLCDQIAVRANPEFALAQYGLRMIPESLLNETFSQQIIAAAHRLSTR